MSIGDKIRITTNWYIIKKGMTGIVKGIGALDLDVEFDPPFNAGHDCDGSCVMDRGLYVPHNIVEVIS